MSAILMEGKKVANKVYDEIRNEISQLKIRPKLAVILVGKDPASHIYVSKKRKICEEIGFHSELHEYSDETPEDELIELIKDISDNKVLNVDGILVQLPLPKHYNKNRVLDAVNRLKDVDCFNSANIGDLIKGESLYSPCTPTGILHLLSEYNISLKGKNVVIINRSMVVGLPLSVMLTQKDATVTICHEYSDVQKHTLCADIIITAVGKYPDFYLSPNFVQPGTIVIDVGINRQNGKVFGDVINFEEMKEKCSYLTPVPGGVGQMTVAVLMQNTLKAAKLKRGIYEIDTENK